MLGADAQGVADHDHRQVGGDVVDEVGLALLAHRVEDLGAGLRDTAGSLSRTRRGVKPLLTSIRRLRWAGSSMSIIIGRAALAGPDAAGGREGAPGPSTTAFTSA